MYTYCIVERATGISMLTNKMWHDFCCNTVAIIIHRGLRMMGWGRTAQRGCQSRGSCQINSKMLNNHYQHPLWEKDHIYGQRWGATQEVKQAARAVPPLTLCHTFLPLVPPFYILSAATATTCFLLSLTEQTSCEILIYWMCMNDKVCCEDFI